MNRIPGGVLWALVALLLFPLTALAQNPDIVVTISESEDPVYAGVGVPGNLTYVVRAQNAGDADATGLEVSVDLTLPPGVTVDSVTPFNGTWSNAFPGTFDVSDLQAPSGGFAGGSGTLTIVLTVSGAAGAATDAISITANVSALDQTDSETNNDFATEHTSIATIAIFQVSKDFSDDSTASVEVQLSCSGGQVDPPQMVVEGPLYSFSVVDFPADTSCTVTETVPTGYTESYAAGCTIDPIVSNLGTYPCQITNTQSPVQLVVNKTFTDGNDADVTIDVVCEAGTVTADDPTASGSDPAEFTISDFPAAGTTCTATETLPSGYAQESSTCTDVAVTAGSTPSCEFVNVPMRATFAVAKTFTDGNPGEIEATISCNTGLPIEQSQGVSPGSPIEFVVVGFDTGELNCTITEDGEAGYVASYYDGTTTNDTGCEFPDVGGGAELSCEITNTPAPVDLVITKDWVFEGTTDGEGLDLRYDLTLYCDAEIVGGYQLNDSNQEAPTGLNGPVCGLIQIAQEAPQGFAQLVEWCKAFHGEGPGDATHAAEVIPDYPESHCFVVEAVRDDAVEVSNGCGSLTVAVGQSDSCTVTNTVFFEGIPTLGQYGLAILALLTLGIGLVGFRRYA